MICATCKLENPQGNAACSNCGNILTGAHKGELPPGEPFFVPPPTTSGKAVASLLFSFLFFFPLTALAAVVLGHLANSDIQKSEGRLKGHGIAVGGLILGYLGIALIPVLLLALTIVLPRVMRSRENANEAAAVGSLREIDSAANSYASTYKNGFPQNLEALAGLGTEDCDHAGLIDGELASGRRDNYVFTYQGRTIGDGPGRQPAPGCSKGGLQGFTLTAEPYIRGTDGQRSFYTDDSGVIRYDDNGTASFNSPPLQ
jgi:type IV pilus assembly protein PilA